MIILVIFMLIICSYTDLRERSISLKLLAAFLISSVLLIVTAYFIRDKWELIGVAGKWENTGKWGFIVNRLYYEPSPLNIASSLLPAGIMYLIHRISQGALGKGDVYMILVLGIMTGCRNTFFLIMISMLMTAVTGMIFIAVKRMDRKSALPYAPFLLGAAILLTGTGYI